MGPTYLSLLVFLAASAIVHTRLRPDPLVVSGGLKPGARTESRMAELSRAASLILANPQARIAVGAMITSQVVMVGVMTMTPLHMTDGGQAAMLGMNESQFINATGLPAEGHQTSAWDMAQLTISLIERFPEHYAVYSERSFKFNDIEQPNRNRLLWRDRTVDGVKTGHTEAAGYCLVASAVRGGMRLVSVVMGTDSDEARMRESQKLLSYGFRYFETQRLYEAGVPLKTARLYYGESEDIELGVAEPVSVTIPRGHYDDLKAELSVPKVLEAPIAEGDAAGELILTLHGEDVYRAPLMALQAVEEAGVFSRLGDWFSLFFGEMFGS